MPRLARWCLLAGLVLGCALGSHAAQAEPQWPVAHAGVLDLTAWDFTRDGMLGLDGEWQFAPNRLVGPHEPWPADARLIQVPGAWNDALGNRFGHGTYRLRVNCKAPQPLAIEVPVEHSATRIFANGREVAHQGTPGETLATHRPEARLMVAPLPDAACPLELRIQVSNHEMQRGGLFRSLQLASSEDTLQRRERSLLRAQLALGAMLFLGLFTMMFVPWGRRDWGGALFALFTFDYAMSLGLMAERPLQSLVEDLGFEAQMRLTFANWAFGTSVLALLLRRLYPAHAGRVPTGIITGFAAAATLLPLVTPARVFTFSTPLLVVGGFAVAMFAVYVLVRALRERQAGAGLLLAGIAVLIVTGWHDSLHVQHLLQMSILPYGMLGFEVALAWMLAKRFARALSAEDLRTIEQRERTDMLVRATKAGLGDWDAVTGQITYSERFKEMFGYPADMPDAGIPEFSEMLHPDERDEVLSRFREQMRGRDVRDGIRQFEPRDYRMRHADGHFIWVHAEAVAVCGPDGRPLRLISSVIDISQSKRHEEEIAEHAAALATERERLRLLVRSTKAGFGDWDAAANVVTYTDRFKAMLGYPPDCDTSDWPSIFEMMHPDDRERAHREFRAMIRRKPTGGEQEPGLPMTYRLRRVDGSYIWIHAEGIAQVDETGRTRRFITSYLDFTQFHEQEQALREQMKLTRTEQRRLDLVVRAARVGIVDWDGHTHETYYSPRFREIRGYPPDADTSGWPDYFKVMIHPEDRERVTKRWVTFIKGKGPEGPRGEYYSPEEYRLSRADGSHTWVEVSGMAVRDDNGFVVRWIAAIIDITERRAQREALRASRDQVAAQAEQLEHQNEALKENVRLREEVERIGRHDLKTPLNSIVAVPRLLREERKLGPEADELLGIVERAGYRILSMVNLSLDLYKMEQDTYIFRPDAVDLAELALKVIAEVRMHAASKQVQLQLQAWQPPFAWAEELLCYSLLANLLKNAVEASPEGGTVSVHVEAGGDETVRVRIHNMGAVPESIRGSFFRKYQTLGKASGTGLGTYSAWLMAKVQDGHTEMHTSDEEGTTLTVTLKAAPAGKVPAATRHAAEQPGPESAQIANLAPMRVLLVDDDEYNLLIVRRYLPTPPFTVDTAINGRVALAAAELQWPDLVLMDLDMPVMGGLQAVGEFRQYQRATLCRPCTIVALSSHDDEDTRRAALAAGFDAYLTKPVTREVIHRMLLELNTTIGRASPAGPPALAAVRTRDDPVCIDPDIQPVLGQFLESRRALLAQLEEAAAKEEQGEVRRLAHLLAGSFALYGFAWASDRSRWLERNFSEVMAPAVREWATELRAHLDTVDIRVENEQASG
ncbi:MAG TPA: PAS domain-containing protein [Ramlibacter sp.]|uniref:PAS domain-containing protein n=1 Tax=Ramlibacter sp. TaxID=1917967 RepID=UPI002CC7EA36|nr:PAS domain-containing protein [Ramlibacter sp.]HVZ43889.1 PAS domain-containing protein [Ramlibacter sp.]